MKGPRVLFCPVVAGSWGTDGYLTVVFHVYETFGVSTVESNCNKAQLHGWAGERIESVVEIGGSRNEGGFCLLGFFYDVSLQEDGDRSFTIPPIGELDVLQNLVLLQEVPYLADIEAAPHFAQHFYQHERT